MPFYSWKTAGAPTVTSADGGICNMMDWLLVTTNGWTKLYESSTARVYQQGGGTGFCLFLDHNSTTASSSTWKGLVVVRGCESASSISTLVDPFPTVSQRANSSILLELKNSRYVTAVPVKWWAWVTNSFILLISEQYEIGDVGITLRRGLFAFGTPQSSGLYGTDSWNCLLMAKGVSYSAPQTPWVYATSGYGIAPSPYGSLFWARDISGTIKSTTGVITSPHSSGLGRCDGMGAYGTGFGSLRWRQQAIVACSGSSTTTPGVNALLQRSYLPNIWLPITGVDADYNVIQGEFIDSRNPGTAADLKAFRAGSYPSNSGLYDSGIIIQTSDNWSI